MKDPNVFTCRSALAQIPLVDERPKMPRATNAGLILSCHLKTAGDKGEAKRSLLEAAAKACKQGHSLYTRAFQRWKPEWAACASKDVRVAGRLVVGLGTESVLETGITLHHTYGVPIIPGSALKGLANHYCHAAWGANNDDYKMECAGENGGSSLPAGKIHRALFGTNEDSGHLIFHDAWITPESLARRNEGLVFDVMTPHHPGYYAPAGEHSPKPPSDYDEPTPVPFLSVAGTFRIAVSCDVASEEGERWARFALALLSEALANWGAGGKTSSGYGRLR